MVFVSVTHCESFGKSAWLARRALGEDDRAGHARKSRRQSAHCLESAAHGSLVRVALSKRADEGDVEPLSRTGFGNGGLHGFDGAL